MNLINEESYILVIGGTGFIGSHVFSNIHTDLDIFNGTEGHTRLGTSSWVLLFLSTSDLCD